MRHSDFLPKGWQRAIGDELNLRIVEFIVKGGSVLQVKEKFGGLRVYTSIRKEGAPPLEISDLEEICERTCMDCGNPGTMTTRRGWIGPRCEVHAE